MNRRGFLKGLLALVPAAKVVEAAKCEEEPGTVLTNHSSMTKADWYELPQSKRVMSRTELEETYPSTWTRSSSISIQCTDSTFYIVKAPNA